MSKAVLARIILISSFLGGIGLVVAALIAGTTLSRPVQRSVGPPPSDLPLVTVEFRSESGSGITGWLASQADSRGGIALFHGIRADRRSMLGRARFLHAHGYSVLLIDLQGHGESHGDQITFGHLESRDVRAAVAFLRERLPGLPIAGLGVSLGGAACLLGPDSLEVDALVLEAVYPDIKQAIENRLRIRYGPLGPWLAPFLTVQIQLRLGLDIEQMRPIDRLAEISAPVLILAGEEDEHTTAEESRNMYEAAPQPKGFWLVPGAAHVDLHRHSPVVYEERVLDFLNRVLGRAGQAH